MNYIINEAMNPLREVANILSSEKPVLTDEVARKIAKGEGVAWYKAEAEKRLPVLTQEVQIKEIEAKGA